MRIILQYHQESRIIISQLFHLIFMPIITTITIKSKDEIPYQSYHIMRSHPYLYARLRGSAVFGGVGGMGEVAGTGRRKCGGGSDESVAAGGGWGESALE